MRTIPKSGTKMQSELLLRTEEIIRSFFQEQFSESPRLLKLEFIGGTIHVHGYRSLAPAEVKAWANTVESAKLQRYLEALVRSARTTLKERLQSGLDESGLEVEWFLDVVQHEFDIVISFAEGTSPIAGGNEARQKNQYFTM